MRALAYSKLILFLNLLWLPSLHAQTINWYSPHNKVSVTSTGQPMGTEFQFQLGVFTSGFIPTSGNLNQWAGHWVGAASGNYNPATMAFDENFTVAGNAVPFVVGASAFIWGRAIGSSSDEWILFRKSDWTWPASNPMDPNGFYWNAATADQVILGSINASGTPFLMKSFAISSYSQWVAAELAGERQNGPNDDPDHDGIPNLLEFVFGTSPLSSNSNAATPVSLVVVNGQQFLQISVPRRYDHLVNLDVQVSSDLNQWFSGSHYVSIVEDSQSALVVRDLTPFNQAAPNRFLRLKATLPWKQQVP